MAEARELSEVVRDKIADLHKTGMSYMTVAYKAAGVIIWKWKKHKITISHPQSAAPCKMLPHGVRIIKIKVVDQPKTTREERLYCVWVTFDLFSSLDM